MRTSRVLQSGVCLLAICTASARADVGSTPAEIFDRLKSLEGTWVATAEQVAGEPHAEEAPMEGRFEFRISAAGTVLMETMGAGSEHEMVNVYYMDGDDLVLTHYCAGGNQPTMKLDPAAAADGRLNFSFTGGTNLDPQIDDHIHSATIEWQEDGRVVSDWTGWSAGREAAVMHFVLTRSE